LVVPKRAARQAHDRNRCRRIIREAFRRSARFLPGVDIVVMLSHGFMPDELALVVAELLKELRIR
jgi:ribonuclease P protein component